MEENEASPKQEEKPMSQRRKDPSQTCFNNGIFHAN